MTRALLVTLLLLVADPAWAELVFEPASLDLGAVKSGQLLIRTITVRNTGPSGVVVREIKVNEMHEILIATRTIGRVLRFVLKWFGGPSAVGTAALYGFRAFTGH